MRSEQQFSNLVYEYFLERIQFRYYKYGDYLPSIDTLCREFSVSALTVKIALQRLRAEGYIDMRNGRSTKVIFQQTPEEARVRADRYYSLRIKSFQDLYQTTKVIIMPLLLECFRRMDNEDLSYLRRLSDGDNADDILQFFCFVFQKMDNPLVMNLYWETSVFWGPLFVKQEEDTYLSDMNLLHREMKKCILLAKEKNWTLLAEETKRFRLDSVGSAVSHLEQIVSPAKKERQIPFVWRIYRDRPQICYSLVSLLLHEIYMGRYRGKDFLPSYDKMAEEYQVSVSTVRRTIKLLNQMGAVRTINGKGTKVLGSGEPCNILNLDNPAIRRNLAFFVQSFELLLYSCDTVMGDYLAVITSEEKRELIRQLEDNLEKERCELSLWCCLLSITRHSPLQGIREIYGRIYSLFLWGYHLKTSHEENAELNQAIHCFTTAMIERLKKNDIDGCAESMKALVTRQFPAAEQFLHKCGFQPEELRLTPSIRLFVTGEGC